MRRHPVAPERSVETVAEPPFAPIFAQLRRGAPLILPSDVSVDGELVGPIALRMPSAEQRKRYRESVAGETTAHAPKRRTRERSAQHTPRFDPGAHASVDDAVPFANLREDNWVSQNRVLKMLPDLSARELSDAVPGITKPNPIDPRWKRMRLYLVRDVRRLARERGLRVEHPAHDSSDARP